MARASGEGSYFEVDIVLPKHTFDFHRSNRYEYIIHRSQATYPISSISGIQPCLHSAHITYHASVQPALETVALHFRDEMSASLRE